jgi:hypothetical protein
VRRLERTQAQLGLLAQREAALQVALQLQELTQEAQLARVQELLADLSTPVQPVPLPEPLSLESLVETVQQETPVRHEQELMLPRRPEPEELEPMPPAEDQLWSQLGGLSSTRTSPPSSES